MDPRHEALSSTLSQLDNSFRALATAIPSFTTQSNLLRRQCLTLQASPSPSDQCSLGLVLARVDNELKALAGLQSELFDTGLAIRSFRNSSPDLVPVARLPDEILQHMFKLGSRDEREVSRQREEGQRFLTEDELAAVIPRLHDVLPLVCHRWREIALELGPVRLSVEFSRGRFSPKLQTLLDMSRS
jgi:hypothetical protein